MVYYFKFEAMPAEGNRYHGKIGYGEADVFVSGDRCGDDLDAMEATARSCITAQTWVPTRLAELRETNSPAPGWDKRLVELYRDAVESGISGFFVASPKDDIPDGPTMMLPPR